MQIILDQFPDLNEKQINQLSRLKNIYETWNNKINVISRKDIENINIRHILHSCLLYTSPSPRDDELSRMPSSA